MSHQTLYRKHRPKSFKDVQGQEHVTGVLIRHVKEEKVPHAFLFSGSRGLGKTSIARILAHELGTTESDLYEIDAASHNSVEDIRELTENVHTLPFDSKYKVYILDEVHMLSKSAWNAFLKTLEEPPAHAIFILATTELEKVPETVRSRTQVFEFRKPSRKDLAHHVSTIAKLEGRVIEPVATDLIALLADGSYRDALSILEKVLGAKQGEIELSEVERVTGAPSHTLLLSFIKAVAGGDAGASLALLRKATAQGVDVLLYSSLLLEYLRTILILRHAKELHKELEAELGKDLYDELAKLASEAPSLTHDTVRLFLEAHGRIKYSPVPQLPLELAVFSLGE